MFLRFWQNKRNAPIYANAGLYVATFVTVRVTRYVLRATKSVRNGVFILHVTTNAGIRVFHVVKNALRIWYTNYEVIFYEITTSKFWKNFVLIKIIWIFCKTFTRQPVILNALTQNVQCQNLKKGATKSLNVGTHAFMWNTWMEISFITAKIAHYARKSSKKSFLTQ